MIRYIKKMASKWMPPICILCRQKSHQSWDLCQACYLDLPILSQTCRRCANILHGTSNSLCGTCLKQPPPFQVTHALFGYHQPVDQLLLALKFNQAFSHGRLLGELLADRIQHQWYREKPLPSAIIPMPLHPIRQRERGFNQSIELARPIAKKLQLPLLDTVCERIKSTMAQASLPAHQRRSNITGAFAIKKPILYRHVVIVDDIITTGHTVRELCHLLKNHEVETIDIWCCARSSISTEIQQLTP